MNARTRNRLIVLISVLLVLWGVLVMLWAPWSSEDIPTATAIREGAPSLTEVAAASLLVPNPADCTVEPRTLEEMVAIAASPVAAIGSPVAATPDASALASPVIVDAEIARDVASTYRLWVACGNAGDFARQYALATDGDLQRILLSGVAITGAEVEMIVRVMQTPAPQLPMYWTAIKVSGDVTYQPDGTVTLFVVTSEVKDVNSGDGKSAIVVFRQERGQWLIDGIYSIGSNATSVASPSGSPAAATPVG